MTNAEKFKEVFGIEIDCGSCNPYPCNENDCEFWEKCESEPGRPCDTWWDWEFKEPTTENDLEVDCISRFEVTEIINEEWDTDIILDRIEALPSVTPQEPKCKDCKWWKDSDGEYRRGCGAESKCRINTDKVYKGEGYCYLFEPQENEDKS